MILPTILLAFINYSLAIKCKSCYSYNNQACIQTPDCESDVCIYEQLNSANGIVHTLRTCATKGAIYTFDDGTTMTNTNQCVTKTTRQGQYYVSLCTSGDYCNLNCRTTVTPIPLVPTIEPIVGTGAISCYDCSTSDGTDCQTNQCKGTYCGYERKLVGNQMYLTKSCLADPIITLDDSTQVTQVDICEVRNTADSSYYVKICNDVNFCNNYCSPGQAQPTLPTPQKQALVTCYDCQGSSDCFTGSCQGLYCIYEKQTRISNQNTYYTKTCSAYPYATYPDKQTTQTIDQCETKILNDVRYEVKICQTGSYCNSKCQNDASNLMTCTQCQASNQNDCSGTTCTGHYCTFVREINQLDPSKSFVKKACSSSPYIAFPDNSIYNNFGACQYKTLSSVQYSVKICNSTSYCNSYACPDVNIPTPSPQNSVSRLNFLLLFIITIIFSAI
ncbi:unnamed protein product [Caenorhabditis angaria]|uniref:UPAR/Ly6 domain-containing protein n=1 Tax=Caenorhabditis angaria TaxID=860376 RepID=A0A9P1I7H1_9PELO|nr:unnamed protein product [Caenorhabditis angaria]